MWEFLGARVPNGGDVKCLFVIGVALLKPPRTSGTGGAGPAAISGGDRGNIRGERDWVRVYGIRVWKAEPEELGFECGKRCRFGQERFEAKAAAASAGDPSHCECGTEFKWSWFLFLIHKFFVGGGPYMGFDGPGLIGPGWLFSG